MRYGDFVNKKSNKRRISCWNEFREKLTPTITRPASALTVSTKADETTQTITAGTYAETAERGQGLVHCFVITSVRLHRHDEYWLHMMTRLWCCCLIYGRHFVKR